MTTEEFRRRLALVYATPILVELEVRRMDAAEIWKEVDAVCAAEPKPAETAFTPDSQRVLDDVVSNHNLAVALERSADLESRLAEVTARAEAAETQLAEAKEIIAIMEEREVKRDEQEEDARACAEWVTRWPNSGGPGWQEAYATAKRYLSGEPAPKAEHSATDVNGEPRIYPCHKCGTMRSKAEGGTVFSVCDGCWTVKDEAFLDLVLLEKFVAGVGGERTGRLMRAGYLVAEVTDAGRLALGLATAPKPAPKPPSEAMEQLRAALEVFDENPTRAQQQVDRAMHVIYAARAVLAEADGGR